MVYYNTHCLHISEYVWNIKNTLFLNVSVLNTNNNFILYTVFDNNCFRKYWEIIGLLLLVENVLSIFPKRLIHFYKILEGRCNYGQGIYYHVF